ncbi:hypothetical protein BKA70DRAFT_1190103 [Coprinopsis sp. MPI-PUGE-AT-0042]|nr:hypothetical protein BKA70DRAFT_1190103 [Coprinopsis sp. MPI-PUGE-AT-0042]
MAALTPPKDAGNALSSAPFSRCPVHSAPVEILTQIFSFACSGEHIKLDPSEDFASEKNSPTAVNISRTCRRWYAASIAFPSLWNHLDIDCQPLFGSDSAGDRFLSCVQGFLERSRRLPLHLLLSGPTSSVRASKSALRPLMKHSHRIISIHGLETDFSCGVSDWWDLRELQSLVLEDFEFQGEAAILAPGLSKVVLLNPCFSHSPLDMSLPWASLRYLSLYCNGDSTFQFPRESELLSILQETANLTHLYINLGENQIEDIQTTFDQRLFSIRLPKLRYLEIQDAGRAFLDQGHLLAFVTPALERFDYYIGHDSHTEFSSKEVSTLNLFVESLHKLKHLRLGYCDKAFLDPVGPIQGRYIFRTKAISGKLSRALFSRLNTARDRAWKKRFTSLFSAREFKVAEWPDAGYVQKLFDWVGENSIPWSETEDSDLFALCAMNCRENMQDLFYIGGSIPSSAVCSFLVQM